MGAITMSPAAATFASNSSARAGSTGTVKPRPSPNSMAGSISVKSVR